MMITAWIALIINVLVLICTFIGLIAGDSVGARFGSFLGFIGAIMDLYFIIQYIYG